MRIPRRYTGARAWLMPLLVLVLGIVIVVDLVEPLTPIEQQALIGGVVTIGCLSLWLL